MTQGEGVVIDGAGSQTGGLARWGDYTSLSVDPSDDCTFWYTGEYLASNGSFNWHTRIGSFKLPGCGSTAPDFSISASPSSLTLTAGASGTSTISTAVTYGSAQTVSLSATGQPAGTTVSFNPSSVTAGGSSTMTVAAGAATTPGTYSITVTGAGTSATHATTVSLTVVSSGGLFNGGFETGNFSGWGASGAFTPVIGTTAHTGTYSARLGSTSPVNGDSTLTQAVIVPSGSPKVTFWYQPHCTDTITYDQIQMQIRNPSGTTLATVLNVCSNTGTWTSVSYDLSAYAGQTVVLWFNDHDDGYATDPTYFLLDDVAVAGTAPTNDFSIGASPTSLTLAQGASGTSTISTAVTSGSAQTVSLGASGAPAGTTVGFNPASVTAGGSSTMTVTVGASTTPGTYTITVTGTGASATHTTTVTLNVQAKNDFSIGASPTSLTLAQGASGTSTISTAVTSGSAQTVSLGASGAPAGTTVGFNPASVTAGGSSTMTVTVGASTAPGTYTITVTGTGASATHTTTVTLTVQQSGATFTLSATPPTQTVPAGGSANYGITITPAGGFNGAVSLSVSGLPNRTSASFVPNPTTTSSSTLAVATSRNTRSGSFLLTITGTGGGVTQTVTVTLVVQ